jgi:hypothetical protein
VPRAALAAQQALLQQDFDIARAVAAFSRLHFVNRRGVHEGDMFITTVGMKSSGEPAGGIKQAKFADAVVAMNS